MTDRADHPLLDRRRFLVAGLGVMLAACAGTDTGDSTDTAAAAPTTDDEPSSPTSSPDDTTASPSPTDEPASPSEEPSAPEPSTPEYPTGVIPVAIVIPAIDVDAPVVDLSLTATEVEVPEDFGDAGWWTQTRRPGEIGPAVIGGHVDSKSGPAVFYRLADLRPGDEVTVADEAGETRSFVVSEDPIRVRKDQRPPEVFGFGQGRPELRLITCGGDFDPNSGHYVDNVIVFCHDPTTTL